MVLGNNRRNLHFSTTGGGRQSTDLYQEPALGMANPAALEQCALPQQRPGTHANYSELLQGQPKACCQILQTRTLKQKLTQIAELYSKESGSAIEEGSPRHGRQLRME